ncbi:MAG: rhodanese-like domain-containing protein [Acidobacteriaceae bacterium]
MEQEITVGELERKLKEFVPQRDAVPLCLLDIREPWEAEVCVLPGSRLIPMSDLPSRAHLELDRNAHIVVYCHHGNRSLPVALWLREQGFEKAQSLAGGIEAWARTIDLSMDQY